MSKVSVGFALVSVALCSYSRGSEYFRNPSGKSDCYASENVGKTVYAKSLTFCALMCIKNGCSVFNRNGDTCELILVGGPAPASSPTLHRRLLPSTALTTKEVARGRPVTGSPHYGTGVPTFITDGITTSGYHSSDNAAVSKPYLLVDLESLQFVEKIRVLPFAGSYGYRFVDTQILIGNTLTTGDFSNYTWVATIAGPISSNQGWMEFDVIPSRCTRYVAIFKYIAHPYDLFLLQVLEIEVMARSY